MKNSYQKEIKKRFTILYILTIFIILVMANFHYTVIIENELKGYKKEIFEHKYYLQAAEYKGDEEVSFITKPRILKSVLSFEDIIIYPKIDDKTYKIYYTPQFKYYSFILRPLLVISIILSLIYFILNKVMQKSTSRFEEFESFLYKYFSNGTIDTDILNRLKSYGDEITDMSIQVEKLMGENLKTQDKQNKFFKTLETLNEVVLELSYDFIIQEHNKPWENIQQDINNFLFYLGPKNIALLQLKSSDLLYDEIDEIVFVDSLKKTNKHFEVKIIHVSTNVFGVIISDITSSYKEQQTTMHKSLHDGLTNLPNRSFFLERLNKEIHKSKRQNKIFAVLFFDLNKFKIINDTYGHTLGDAYLIEFAKRISSAMRSTDTCARLGGDEFMALLPNLKSLDEIDIVIDKIYTALDVPFEYDFNTLTMAASIGVSVFPNDGENADLLILKADNAMYKCKKSENKYCRYTENILE